MIASVWHAKGCYNTGPAEQMLGTNQFPFRYSAYSEFKTSTLSEYV
jgi:hypothetical protein